MFYILIYKMRIKWHYWCLLFVIHNIYIVYPWYTGFRSGIHNIYVWYDWHPWYAILKSSTQYTHFLKAVIRDAENLQYAQITSMILCLVDPISSNLSLSNFSINVKIGRLVIFDHDPLSSKPVTWLNSLPNAKFDDNRSKNGTTTRQQTIAHTHTPKKNYANRLNNQKQIDITTLSKLPEPLPHIHCYPHTLLTNFIRTLNCFPHVVNIGLHCKYLL